MPTIKELVTQYEKQILQLTAQQALENPGVIFLDCREQDELSSGIIPDSVWIPKGQVELSIEKEVPKKETPLVVYCASGFRSVLVAKILLELGYKNAASLVGGFNEWKALGNRVARSPIKIKSNSRYKAHLALPQIGEVGQRKLQESRVLIIGAGGLGSPISMYLAAAGVGTIGIVDDDYVDESNLQRQILHTTDRIGLSKADSAFLTLKNLNPYIQIQTYKMRFSADHADQLLAEYDYIIDGSDNFKTRYLVNLACLKNNKPNIHGSVIGFQGQVSLFCLQDGPCFRCLFEQPPQGELAPNCAEGGVLGPLVGVIGTLVAVETVKLILNLGESLKNKLLVYDAIDGRFDELLVTKNPKCPTCSKQSKNLDYNSELSFIDVCLRR